MVVLKAVMKDLERTLKESKKKYLIKQPQQESKKLPYQGSKKKYLIEKPYQDLKRSKNCLNQRFKKYFIKVP